MRPFGIILAMGTLGSGCGPAFPPNDSAAVLAIAQEFHSYGDVHEPDQKDSGR